MGEFSAANERRSFGSGGLHPQSNPGDAFGLLLPQETLPSSHSGRSSTRFGSREPVKQATSPYASGRILAVDSKFEPLHIKSPPVSIQFLVFSSQLMR